MEVPQKVKNRAMMQSSNSTTEYVSKENKNTNLNRNTCTPTFTAALFKTTKIWKQSKCPTTHERIKKLWCI